MQTADAWNLIKYQVWPNGNDIDFCDGANRLSKMQIKAVKYLMDNEGYKISKDIELAMEA